MATQGSTYRYRFMVGVEVEVRVTAPDEDTAYDQAVELGEEALSLAHYVNGVTLSGTLDGVGAHESHVLVDGDWVEV